MKRVLFRYCPHLSAVYALGVVVKMTEAMGMAVAHNIAIELGENANPSVTAILQVICMTDFSDRALG